MKLKITLYRHRNAFKNNNSQDCVLLFEVQTDALFEGGNGKSLS